VFEQQVDQGGAARGARALLATGSVRPGSPVGARVLQMTRIMPVREQAQRDVLAAERLLVAGALAPAVRAIAVAASPPVQARVEQGEQWTRFYV
jgi:hypothetical protein